MYRGPIFFAVKSHVEYKRISFSGQPVHDSSIPADCSFQQPSAKVRVCPMCARKLFHKKIEALRRQQVEQAERDQRRKGKAASSANDDVESTAKQRPDRETLEESKRRGEDPDSVQNGHELVKQAVEATGGSIAANSEKRRRRWSAALETDDNARGRTEMPASGSGNGDGAGNCGDPASSQEGSQSDDMARKAWAGDLEKDQTAEDEMDDYLSSLLL